MRAAGREWEGRCPGNSPAPGRRPIRLKQSPWRTALRAGRSFSLWAGLLAPERNHEPVGHADGPDVLGAFGAELAAVVARGFESVEEVVVHTKLELTGVDAGEFVAGKCANEELLTPAGAL